MRSAYKWATRCLAIVILTVLVLEFALRLASSFSEDRSGAGWEPGARVRILAIGDSHTFGPAVEPGEAYPGQLQRILDERAPGVYSVINVGIPGTNTTQNLNRLRQALADRDHVAARQLAHTLKGTAGNLSGIRMMDIARQLEHAVLAGDAAQADDLFPELEASSRNLHDQLSGFVAAAEKNG